MASSGPCLTLFESLPEFTSHPALINPPVGLAYSEIRSTPEYDDITFPPDLTTDDFPDSEEGRILAGAFAHIEHTFAQGFVHPTLNPSAFLSRDEWLLMVANLLRSIKDSISITTRSATSPSHAFQDISQEETTLLTSIESLSFAITEYFSTSTVDTDSWDQCMSCLSHFHVSLTEMDWRAIVGVASGDIHAAHTMMINKKIHKLSSELDSWAEGKCAYLQDLLITAITNDTSPSIPENELRIKAWIDATHVEAHACVRAMLINDELSDLLLVWANDQAMNAKGQILQCVDADVREYE